MKIGKGKLDVLVHFPVPLLAACLLFTILLWMLIFSFGRYNQSDIDSYRKLVQGAQLQSSDESYSSRQHRSGIRKDVFFVENGQRLQLNMVGSSADLVLERMDGKFEIAEHLNDVECCIQEKLLYMLPGGRLVEVSEFNENMQAVPVQRILLLKAKAATYHYSTELFIADNVQVSRYIANGHTIEERSEKIKPVTAGTAQRVQFSLAGHALGYKADKLKIKFFGEEQ